MVDLKDLVHLAEVDGWIEQLAADGPGLVVVAGFDPMPMLPPSHSGFLPSGRAGFLRILLRHMLASRASGRDRIQTVVVATSEDAIRLPRELARKANYMLVKPGDSFAERIAAATEHRPPVLVIEALNAATVSAALQAAQSGLRVLSQIDTVFTGADVLRHLLDLGAQPEQLSAVNWVATIQRIPTLCATCKHPVELDTAQLERLQRRYSTFDGAATYMTAEGCPVCEGTGRRNEVAAFDIFHASANTARPMPGFLHQPSDLSMEDYLLQLAAQGYVSLEDATRFEAEQLRRTYTMLAVGERVWAEQQGALQRKVLELEASNRVLQQRTEALISLEKLGSALITSTDLAELGATVCQLVRTLCGAERAILYFLRSEIMAEVLAVAGWSADLVHLQLDAELVFGPDRASFRDNAQPAPFAKWPPGVPYREPDVEGARVYEGLRLPLIAQDKLVGLLIVHPTSKWRFAPGEVALLRTLANQAALAIQRAELVEDLRAKIVQLQTAQAELVKKERMDREMELARQVQQRLLPHTFPSIPGYTFAAQNLPARQVGGDFYDVMALDEHRFGVVIADVSDKGMPAALFMTLTRSLLMAEAERESSPRAVLHDVNRLLLALGEGQMFVAVFYGVVDTRARTLTYVRAGHERPLLLRDDAVLPLGGEGLVLGQLEDDMLRLSEERMALQPGDKLVLHTDGLTDVPNDSGEMYGLERLKQLLRLNAHLPPAELCQATFQALALHQGAAEQFDDMAMLVVAVT